METLVEITCPQCQCQTKLPLRAINAAKKRKGKVYCSRVCSGLARRLNKTKEQQKEEKRLYDIKYREKNEERLKAKRAEWFQKDYKGNPDKYKAIRKAKQSRHNEYCRKPEYREKKKKYDEVYLAKKKYGEFWESAILVRRIQEQYDKKEVKQANNLINKSQIRKRSWQQIQQNLQRQT